MNVRMGAAMFAWALSKRSRCEAHPGRRRANGCFLMTRVITRRNENPSVPSEGAFE